MVLKVLIARSGASAFTVPLVAAAALLAMAACASATQTAEPVVAVTGQTERVRIVPLSPERAFAQFRTICMDTFPDPEAFDRAAEASDLRFERSAPALPGQHRWTSRHGTLTFNTGGAMADGRPMIECDLRLAIRERLEPAELIEGIEAALAPGRRRRDVAGAAVWDLGGDFADRLSYFPLSDDPRFFSLNRRRIDEDAAR